MANKQSVHKRKAHEHEHKKAPKKDYTMVIFWVIVGILVIVLASQFLFNNGDGTGDSTTTTLTPEQQTGLDAFAQCITDKGATFYGTEWCPHCKAQKEIFGSSMEYVNYVDCDDDRDKCTVAGIKGYPTWKVPGKSDLVGTQQLSNLASATGCTL